MGIVNCAVVGCTNNSGKLDKWKASTCEIHLGLLHKECGCEAPFRLYCFPGPVRYREKRDRWIHLLKRENMDKTSWKPKGSDRVCSRHFVDNIPTVANPDPTLNLGYTLPTKTSRRKVVRTLLPKKKSQAEEVAISGRLPFLSPPQSPPTPSASCTSRPAPDVIVSPPPSDHPYCNTMQNSANKDSIIEELLSEINSLTLKNKKLTRDNLLKKNSSTPFSWKKIKSDSKMNFYTGITKILAFNVIFDLIKPYVDEVIEWKGPSKMKNYSKVKRKPRKCQRPISRKDEFLLCLMKLRLGLLNEDLADRFHISKSLCSNIFKTWIRTLGIILGGALVHWMPKESILDHMPEIFKERGYTNVRCIIDCAEVFIERSKSLAVQAATWSDYKHHNTFKFLIGIAPTGFITFLSDCYGGRASDRFICNDSGFFDLLEYGDCIMADRGFQIQEELLLRYCQLSVPPGARMKSQMTYSECSKTKSVANLRIHVERCIRRIKTYRILMTTMPITMMHHIDDIIKTCAALCNLKNQLIQPGEKKKKK